MKRGVQAVMESPLRGFSLTRVYGASTAIYLAALLVSLRWRSLGVSLGVTAGAALGLFVLFSSQFVVSRALDPMAPKRGLALALGLVKLPLLAGVVYVLVGRELVSGAAFAAGVAIPTVAAALLALGRVSDGMSSATRGKEPAGAAPRA